MWTDVCAADTNLNDCLFKAILHGILESRQCRSLLTKKKKKKVLSIPFYDTLKNLVLNQTAGLTVPAYPSLTEAISKRLFLQELSVWCLCLYVLFHICVGTGYAGWTGLMSNGGRLSSCPNCPWWPFAEKIAKVSLRNHPSCSPDDPIGWPELTWTCWVTVVYV